MAAGRPCKCCLSPHLAEINKILLLQGGSKSAVAGRFGLTESGVQRHRANCLGYKSRAAVVPPSSAPVIGPETARFDPKDPQSLITTTARLVDEALDLLENAKRADDRRTALVALREARDGLALLMRTAGMLTDGASVIVDQRRQTVQVLGGLTLDELRNLARLDASISDGDAVSLAPSPQRQRPAEASDAHG